MTVQHQKVRSSEEFPLSETEVARFSDVKLYIPICDTENIREVFQLNTCYWLAVRREKSVKVAAYFWRLFVLDGRRGQSRAKCCV